MDQAVQPDAGGGKGCGNQPEVAESHSIVIKQDDFIGCSEVENEIYKWQKPKMQKVPRKLRKIESNKECFDPLVVSIGPYHHGKPELEPMEKFKILWAQQYAKLSQVPIGILYNKVAEVARDARECYLVGSTDEIGDEAFARMMFLDGCFVLHFIYCIIEGKQKDLKIKSNDTALVRRDLFLLENQVPFQVLEALMSFKFKKNEGEHMIKCFIMRSKEIVLEERGVKQPLHLLELVRAQLIDFNTVTEEYGCYLTGDWYTHRSAKDFKAAGIHFKPSKTSRITDITFESKGTFGQMTLPLIKIDDLIKSFLLNLVAYEACPDSPDDFGVTSYVCFMDTLIDDAEDVKVLRKKGVLWNCLGSDQQVADLFNEITKDLVPSPHSYLTVKSRIEQHHKNNMKIWMAEWRQNYLRSPWTVIAVSAAILAIFLTLIQTILGGFPDLSCSLPTEVV
ncbi:hypothetical protein F0562_015493 [Nyssa sinensis]|uniref:Uncharacterized protein n=1 Tax=Nyssa sinensis TaxID=561372 RepID=A0A5J4ZKC8_9ASTE|nr:hypothetical protein F0562_015493 [Nyssa sinensis]